MARRKTSTDRTFIKTIILISVVYLFVWLYDRIGGIGLLFLITCFAGGWLYLSHKKRTQDAESFEADALLTLYKRLDPETARAMIAKYSKQNHRQGELLRLIQIFSDSIEISLNSKKVDTAESRFTLAKETHQKIINYRNIMRPKLMMEINTKVHNLESNFISTLTLNVAKAHIEKADSLKTEKSKLKYLQEALNVLEDGHARGADTSPEVVALTEIVRARISQTI